MKTIPIPHHASPRVRVLDGVLEWLADSLRLMLAIWVPILCALGVLVIVMTLWIPGLILSKCGAGLLWLGRWLYDTMETIASRFFYE